VLRGGTSVTCARGHAHGARVRKGIRAGRARGVPHWVTTMAHTSAPA